MDDHPEVRLKEDDGVLFSVYPDWVHQNIGTNLDGGINKGGKWKYRWEKLVYLPNQR